MFVKGNPSSAIASVTWWDGTTKRPLTIRGGWNGTDIDPIDESATDPNPSEPGDGYQLNTWYVREWESTPDNLRPEPVTAVSLAQYDVNDPNISTISMPSADNQSPHRLMWSSFTSVPETIDIEFDWLCTGTGPYPMTPSGELLVLVYADFPGGEEGSGYKYFKYYLGQDSGNTTMNVVDHIHYTVSRSSLESWYQQYETYYTGTQNGTLEILGIGLDINTFGPGNDQITRIDVTNFTVGSA